VNEKADGISKRYAHFLLDWIREWPLSTRHQILAESLILNESILFCFLIHNLECLYKLSGYLEIRSDIEIDAKYLWNTMLDENNIELIEDWIEYSYSNETTATPNESLFSIKLDQEMIEMISSIKVISNDKKNALLNKLAR